MKNRKLIIIITIIQNEIQSMNKLVNELLLLAKMEDTTFNNYKKFDLSKEKNEINLQVKNEGEPIPKEEQSKIFERFYRVDKARNRDEKRYGLGLAIAKQTVEKYKGTIEVNCKDGITNFIVKISD